MYIKYPKQIIVRDVVFSYVAFFTIQALTNPPYDTPYGHFIERLFGNYYWQKFTICSK